MENSTHFNMRILHRYVSELILVDDGQLNVPVLGAIYDIIEEKYLNANSFDLYQSLSVGGIRGEQMLKKDTVPFSKLSTEKQDTLTYIVFQFLYNIPGRLIPAEVFTRYQDSDDLNLFFAYLPPANVAILGSLVNHLARIVTIVTSVTAEKMSKRFDAVVFSSNRRKAEKFIERLIQLELDLPKAIHGMLQKPSNQFNTETPDEVYDNVEVPRQPGGGRWGQHQQVDARVTRSTTASGYKDTTLRQPHQSNPVGVQSGLFPGSATALSLSYGANQIQPSVHTCSHVGKSDTQTEDQVMKDDIRKLEKENTELKTQIERYIKQDEMRSINETHHYEELKNKYDSLVDQNQSFISSYNMKKQYIKDLQKQLANTEEAKNVEIKKLKDEYEILKTEKFDQGKALRREIDATNEKMEKIITKNDNTSQIQSGEVSTLKTAKATLEKRNDKLLARIKTLETENTTLTQSIETERENVQLKQSTIATKQKIIEDLEVKNKELERKISDHINEYDQISKQLNDSESMCEKRKTAIDNLRTQKKNADQEHNSSMEQMVKNHREEVVQQKNDMEKDKEKTVAKIRKTFSEKISRYGTDCMNLAEEIRTGTCISSHSSQNGYQDKVSRGNSDLERQNELLVAQLTEKENEIKRYKSQKPEQRNTSTNANGAQNKKYGCKSCSYRTHDGYELQKHMLACTGY